MINKVFVVSFPSSMQSIADKFEEEMQQEIQKKLKEIAPDGFTCETVEGIINPNQVKPSNINPSYN